MGMSHVATGVPRWFSSCEKEGRVNFLYLEVYIFRFPALAAAMPILVNYLFSGVIDGQAPSHVTQTWLGMPLNCLCPIPSSINQWETDLDSVKCSFFYKAV